MSEQAVLVLAHLHRHLGAQQVYQDHLGHQAFELHVVVLQVFVDSVHLRTDQASALVKLNLHNNHAACPGDQLMQCSEAGSACCMHLTWP